MSFVILPCLISIVSAGFEERLTPDMRLELILVYGKAVFVFVVSRKNDTRSKGCPLFRFGMGREGG